MRASFRILWTVMAEIFSAIPCSTSFSAKSLTVHRVLRLEGPVEFDRARRPLSFLAAKDGLKPFLDEFLLPKVEGSVRDGKRLRGFGDRHGLSGAIRVLVEHQQRRGDQ